MSTASAATSAFAATGEVEDDGRRQHVIASYECSRIGLTASAPYSFSVWDLVRVAFRRRNKSAG